MKQTFKTINPNHISRSGIEYDIDYDRKTVKATVTDCIRDFNNSVRKQWPNKAAALTNDTVSEILGTPKYIKDEYVGFCKCYEEDDFDLEYGMDLARTKALLRREFAFTKALEKFMAMCDRDKDRYQKELEKRGAIHHRHVQNYLKLFTTERPLFDKEQDQHKAFTNVDGVQVHAHSCALCGKEELSYDDEANVAWHFFNDGTGKTIEMCDHCYNETF